MLVGLWAKCGIFTSKDILASMVCFPFMLHDLCPMKSQPWLKPVLWVTVSWLMLTLKAKVSIMVNWVWWYTLGQPVIWKLHESRALYFLPTNHILQLSPYTVDSQLIAGLHGQQVNWFHTVGFQLIPYSLGFPICLVYSHERTVVNNKKQSAALEQYWIQYGRLMMELLQCCGEICSSKPSSSFDHQNDSGS